jgi:hypothetical protein
MLFKLRASLVSFLRQLALRIAVKTLVWRFTSSASDVTRGEP